MNSGLSNSLPGPSGPKGTALYSSILLVAVAAAFFLFTTPEASSQVTPDLECRIGTGAPDADETILFTIGNSAGGTNNAHAAEPSGPDAYANRIMCTNITDSSFQQASDGCPTGQSGVLSLSNYTNAHVEAFGTGNYDWQACGRSEDEETGRNELNCVVRTGACQGFETSLVSLQNGAGGTTNAHVASPGFYANNLCCSLRCEGASCVTVTTPAPEAFSPTDEFVTFDVNLFNRNGNESVRVEVYLRNIDDYTDPDGFGQYGTWEFLVENATGNYYPAQVTVGPQQTENVKFKIRAPPRAPPSTDLAPYSFIVRVRNP